MRFSLAIAILAAAAAPASAADPAKLNVLFIVADDLNCQLGCYGNAVVRTPNIDRLAARGVRFERSYCNYPVCNASRTSFPSGRYPDTTQVFRNNTDPRIRLGKEFQFLPEYFRAHGYFTGGIGKIAHGAFPEAIEQFLGLPLQDEQRRKILWDNCARLYKIETPAAPLTRDAPQQVSAAE